MKKYWSVLVISALSIANPMCLQAEGTPKLKVIAANSIAGDWVKNVAGDLVDLKLMVGPDGDVHTFEPTPMDNVSMGDADLVFEIGLGFEHWMDKMYLASGSKAKRIILSRGIVNNPLSTPHEHHDHHAYGHRHEDIDPHVWHNVRYVIGMVSRIRESLSNKDPVHALEYARNAEAYISELEELDRWILLSMAQIPKSKRKLVTNHDSLSYYCERYQLELIGVLIDSFTTEAQDPSARDMAELIFKIKKEGVPAVFAERSSNSKTLQALAQEAGITAAPSLYTDALGPPGSEADTYIKFMRFNTETIVKNLL